MVHTCELVERCECRGGAQVDPAGAFVEAQPAPDDESAPAADGGAFAALVHGRARNKG